MIFVNHGNLVETRTARLSPGCRKSSSSGHRIGISTRNVGGATGRGNTEAGGYPANNLPVDADRNRYPMNSVTVKSSQGNEPTVSDGAENVGGNFFVNIEGNFLPWPQDTITTEQIAKLGGWDLTQGVIEVGEDNTERTLAPGEIIQLTPGQTFGKKHKWKRG